MQRQFSGCADAFRPWLLVLSLGLVGLVGLGLSTLQAAAQDGPAFYFGSVTINGEPAPPGTRVEAVINGQVCGADNTVVQDGTSFYLIELPFEPGCGEPDAVIEFFVNGTFATDDIWISGSHEVPLGISEEPTVTATPPPATPTPPPATPTPAPATPSPIPTTPPATVVPSPTGIPCPGAEQQANLPPSSFLGCGKAHFDPPADTRVDSAVTVSLFISLGANPILVVQGSGGGEPADECTPPVAERDVAVFTAMSARLVMDAATFDVSLDGEPAPPDRWVRRESASTQQLQWEWTVRPLSEGEFTYRLLYGIPVGNADVQVGGWQCVIEVGPGGEVGGGESSGTNLAPIIGGIAGGLVLAGLGLAAYATGLLGALVRRGDQPRVFLSYRRSDTAGWVGRINEHLSGQFGHDHVFMDVVDIEGGADWAQRLADTVAAADALIVLIGPRWTGPNPDGTRRIDDPRDWVRVEVGQGLRRPGMTVIPALVDGVRMSDLRDIPADLQPLRARNAIEISQVHFDADMKRLVQSLRAGRRQRPAKPSEVTSAG